MVSRSRFLCPMFYYENDIPTFTRPVAVAARFFSYCARPTLGVALVFLMCGAVGATVCRYSRSMGEYRQPGCCSRISHGHPLLPMARSWSKGELGGGTGLIDSPTAEFYDPFTGIQLVTGRLNCCTRPPHRDIRSPDGRVLVAGGDIAGGFYGPSRARNSMIRRRGIGLSPAV